MPHPTQHSLIPFLLLWIAILSIVQVVVIVLFFTAGHHYLINTPSHPRDITIQHNKLNQNGAQLSQNSSAVAPERPMQFQANNTPLSPSKHGRLVDKGTMLTFKATEVTRKMKWSAKNPDFTLISEDEGGKVLKIQKDGYFLLNLQVTLSSCATWESQHTVSMKSNNEVILLGLINSNTCSTGLLGKVEGLYAGSTLEVIVILPAFAEPINETFTHLDIIYMP